MYTRLEGLVKTLRNAGRVRAVGVRRFAWSLWRLFGIRLASGWVGLAVAVQRAHGRKGLKHHKVQRSL